MKEHSVSHSDKYWKKLEHIRKEVIQTIGENIDLYGIAPSIGRLYGTMYFHNQPMTLDEMRDALGMSKTSMSTGIRSLLSTKMVQKTWEKGVRKDLYTVEEDWYKTFSDLFSTKWGRGIEINIGVIKKSKEELNQLLIQTSNEELRATIEQDMDKLQHAIEYYEWLTLLINSFETGEIFNFIPKPSHKTK